MKVDEIKQKSIDNNTLDFEQNRKICDQFSLVFHYRSSFHYRTFLKQVLCGFKSAVFVILVAPLAFIALQE